MEVHRLNLSDVVLLGATSQGHPRLAQKAGGGRSGVVQTGPQLPFLTDRPFSWLLSARPISPHTGRLAFTLLPLPHRPAAALLAPEISSHGLS